MTNSVVWDNSSFNARASVVDENALLIKYMHLVKRAVTHLRSQIGTLQSYEDLVQIGTMGLLEAIRRYGSEPDYGFESYAFQRIRGEILDELRRQDWRPRQARQQGHSLNHARRTLSRTLGREANEKELMAFLEIDAGQLQDMIFDSVSEEMQSLDELLQAGIDITDENSDIQKFDIKRSLKKTLSLLDQRDQLLLTLYYQYELNMKEISLTLRITESRVCQLHQLALKKLHSHLTNLL